jgi:hypothetical protein
MTLNVGGVDWLVIMQEVVWSKVLVEDQRTGLMMAM